jgi:hypothetical protein
MYQSQYSLILYPIYPDFSYPQRQLLKHLNSMGLLGASEAENRYLVGEQFLSLFCFMGCSPHINLFPQQDREQPYCYIEIPAPTKATQCVISQNVKVPRCPHCKMDLSAWAQQLKQSCSHLINCSHCSTPLIVSQLNWRKSAFFAKNQIIIGNIYEAEALPDQHLLTQLEQATQVEWKYAYIRH